MKKKLVQYPAHFDKDLFVIPRYFNMLGIYLRQFNDDEFTNEIKKAKVEWAKWDRSDWMITMERVCWALFRLFKSLYEINKDLQHHKYMVKELEAKLEEIKDLHPALFSLFQLLIENKNIKEV